MKKLVPTLIALWLVSILILGGCAAPSPSSSPAPAVSSSATAKPTSTTGQQVWNLKLSHDAVATGAYQVYGHQPWVDEVSRVTAGRVKITIYPAETLVKTTDIWTGVKTNITDIGFVSTTNFPGQFDLMDAVTLPFVAPSGEVISRTAWALFNKYPEIQAQTADAKVLAAWASDPMFIVGNKKNFKIPGDLTGAKIRCPGGPPTEMMKLIGASPVAMPTTEIYQNLQKGVIDASVGSTIAFMDRRMYEVAPYITYVPLSTVAFYLVMNKNVWNGFPADIQQALMSISGEPLSIRYGKDVYDKSFQNFPGAIKATGAKTYEYTVPATDMPKWVDISGKPVWDNWVKNMAAKGKKDVAANILADTLSMVKGFNK